MSNRPLYNLAKRALLGPPPRPPLSGDNLHEWIDATIAWDKAHPMRYRLWRIYIVLTAPKESYRNFVYWPIRTFWERGRRGWSVSDTWSIDYYLSKIVPEMIERLRDNNIAWPGDPLTIEEWNEILTKIARGFRAHGEISDMSYLEDGEHYNHEKHQPMEDALMEEWKEGAELFVKWYGHLWD